MQVALTGGTGALGAAVVTRLLDEGHAVRALTRADRGQALPEPAALTWVAGSLEEPAALDELCRGADAILHCAYLDTDDPERFVQANVVGTLRLLTRTAAVAGGQFVFVSSLAVYGNRPGHRLGNVGASPPPMDEDHTLWPQDFYGAHKLALEKMVIAASGDLGYHTSVFRVGCLLGRYPDPRRDPLTPFVRDAREVGEVRRRVGAYVITATDAAAILVGALGASAVRARVFNTFDRWLHSAALAGPLGAAVGREVRAVCDPAPEPTPGLDGTRVRGLPFARFATEQQLLALCRDHV